MRKLSDYSPAYQENISRRALVYIAAGGSAAALAGCSAAQVANVQSVVAGLITQVQAGVATACAAYGKFVPTATSVFQVLASFLGTLNNPVLDVTVATAATIASAVASIAGVACKAAPVGGSLMAGITIPVPEKAPVHVTFY